MGKNSKTNTKSECKIGKQESAWMKCLYKWIQQVNRPRQSRPKWMRKTTINSLWVYEPGYLWLTIFIFISFIAPRALIKCIWNFKCGEFMRTHTDELRNATVVVVKRKEYKWQLALVKMFWDARRFLDIKCDWISATELYLAKSLRKCLYFVLIFLIISSFFVAPKRHWWLCSLSR